MYTYTDIRHVHLEVSTLCNAKCPLCPRNFRGYDYNLGYPEVNLTLKDAETIFTTDFLKQLNYININGNFGDAVMNPEVPEIIKYFKNVNPNLIITLCTNGGARNSNWWLELAKTGTRVIFDLDGLEDTHSLHRQNTLFKTVLKNAKTFIDAGGIAEWKFIVFDHNRHQIEQCRQLSKQLGFETFDMVDHGRDTTAVYNNSGNLSHLIGKPTDVQETVFKQLNNTIEWKEKPSNYSSYATETDNIKCKVTDNKSVYISANGDVYPCCWTGNYPKTYKLTGNTQIKELANNNNALDVGIKNAIHWFDSVKQSWDKKTYKEGRLFICDNECGGCN